MQVLTTDEISPRQHLTPEGFLLCLEVPVARVGEMIYVAGEVPVEPGSDGLCRVYRNAEHLFADDAIQSLLGKDVIDEHPPAGELVTPKNRQKLSRGTVLNPRQGTGDNSDVIMCDLLIMDKDLIRKRQEGKVEVSAGYEADYEDNGDGTGQQTNIIFNHVALVERGRCGPRCAIGDHQPTNPSTQETPMPATQKPATQRKPVRLSFMDRLRQLVNDADNEMAGQTTAVSTDPMIMQDEASEADGPAKSDAIGGGDAQHIHIHVGGGGANDYSEIAGTDKIGTTDEGAVPAEGGDVGTRVAALEAGLTELKAMMQKLLGMQAQDIEGDEAGREQVQQAVEGRQTTDEAPEACEGAPTMDEADGPAGTDALSGADDSKRATTGDSAALSRSYQQVLADASILVPGFRMPTFDAKATRAATVDTMCAARRRALDIASATEEGAALIGAVSGGATLDIAKMTCGAVATIFTAASGAKKLANNRAAVGDAGKIAAPAREIGEARHDNVVGAFDSVDDLNKFYREHYGQ